MDFTDGTDRNISPSLTTQLNKWYKVKFVHYYNGNNYRIRATIDDEVIVDVKNLSPKNYKNMKLITNSTTSIGNLQKIRIAGKIMIFHYVLSFIKLYHPRDGIRLFQNNIKG